MKSNSAIATRGVITFGSEAAHLFEQLTQEQQDQVFKEVAEAVAKRLSTSLHGLVVHLDEATIHAHYQLAAYDVDGNPISKTTRPAVLSELQDITAEIMARHCPGIERGRSYGDRIAAGADYADTMHKSVKELHRTLPADLAAKRAELDELAQVEAQAQARVDEMQDRVNKLTEKSELSSKELKRLETYHKRLEDRLKELQRAQAVSEAAGAEAERRAEIVMHKAQNDRELARKGLDEALQVHTAADTRQAALRVVTGRVGKLLEVISNRLGVKVGRTISRALKEIEADLDNQDPTRDSGLTEKPVQDAAGSGFSNGPGF